MGHPLAKNADAGLQVLAIAPWAMREDYQACMAKLRWTDAISYAALFKEVHASLLCRSPRFGIG